MSWYALYLTIVLTLKKKKKSTKNFFFLFLEIFFWATKDWKSIQSRMDTWSPGIEIPYNLWWSKKNLKKKISLIFFSNRFIPSTQWSLRPKFSLDGYLLHLDFEETNFHPCCSNSKPLGNALSSKKKKQTYAFNFI